MNIAKITIRGFRSFGPDKVEIPLTEDLTGVIGLNSSGKTTALESLRKVFGGNFSEREIYRHDFHVGKEENLEEITERELSIEVRIEFSDEEGDAVPHFFGGMIVDEEAGSPYLRLRLEAKWQKSELLPDGLIESKTYFIKVAEGEAEDSDNKQLFPNHFRALFQVIYVPAIRKPSEQLRYVSGSILYRVLKKIKWNKEFKDSFDDKIDEINEEFKNLPEFTIVQNSISEFWSKFHKDDRYKDTTLGFGGSDFDSILRKLEISFSPTGTHKAFGIDDLGEGYRSLFYLTLVCALLDIEEQLSGDEDEEEIGINRPLLTILAIEEPENHIAPQLLGRVIKILKNVGEQQKSQVLLSSHTPAIVKRLKPESILHFRITNDYETEVNSIILPEKDDEAYKYIKEAVYNYPEIYFARLVVIGEGDSEEIIFNRLMEVLDVDFDDNIITFAPLGHRFVNHIWRLLKALHIPYITLLDLDIEREGGGWGRVKYALAQLMALGISRETLLKLSDDTIMSEERFDEMHKFSLKNEDELKSLYGWVKFLKCHNIFYSAPLDLDYLMLSHYTTFYNIIIPKGGGPRMPKKVEEPEKFAEKVEAAVQATLKSEKAKGINYTEDQKELMIWYNYHFLGRGKPTTHIQALSKMTPAEIKANLPPIFKEIFDIITKKLM